MDQKSNAAKREQNSFALLRRFVRPRVSAERCDFCGLELPAEHQHLLDPAGRQILCTCHECLVSVGYQEGKAYKRVPSQVKALPGFEMNDSTWDDLMIPVGMAFFFYSSTEQKMMAYYPSPAGATESLLSLDAWEEVARDNKALQEMEPDVEALLVNRVKGAREYFLAPIDRCYELVGLIKINWRGLSGGSEVWEEIRRFYSRMKELSEANTPSMADTASTSADAAGPDARSQLRGGGR